MKIYKTITIIVLALLLLQGFGFYNLKVSYKYEVDLKTSHYISEGKTNFTTIERREREIIQKREQLINRTIFLSLLLIVLIIVMIYKRRRV